MSTPSLTASVPALEVFLKNNEEKELLRFSTAGSVDDGKSTLIGRLLYDSRGVYEDQLAAVKQSTVNRASGPIDFSLLTDGLRAEREQGITIDVAYRYFATSRRKFIIADTPGHEQYTRNMATGASTADATVILVDARLGVLPQSRRHAYIASLLGIPQVVVAANKMDLVGYSEDVFRRIVDHFTAYLHDIGITQVQFIPISALEGDNVVHRTTHMPWYDGPTLLEHLEALPIAGQNEASPFRFPVQYVIRPDLNFRGYGGQVASGLIRPGDTVLALPSGRTATVRSITTFEGDLSEAYAPMSVAITLEEEIDISRGDMLVHPQRLPHVTRSLKAKLVWMNERPLALNHPYLLKHTTQQVTATVASLEHKVDVTSLAQLPAAELQMNEIGTVTIETKRPLFFDPYRANRLTGSFILIDPLSNATLAAGMIESSNAESSADRRLRSSLLQVETTRLTPAERYARAGHYPAVIWLTGREELAYVLERRLFDRGAQVQVLADMGESRVLPEVAQLLTSAGLISIFVSPVFDWEERDRTRTLVGSERFLEFPPHALNPDDERAAAEILGVLEYRGVLRKTDVIAGEAI
jgi:sulfate adenylyltransferase large subunit